MHDDRLKLIINSDRKANAFWQERAKVILGRGASIEVAVKDLAEEMSVQAELMVQKMKRAVGQVSQFAYLDQSYRDFCSDTIEDAMADQDHDATATVYIERALHERAHQ